MCITCTEKLNVCGFYVHSCSIQYPEIALGRLTSGVPENVVASSPASHRCVFESKNGAGYIVAV